MHRDYAMEIISTFSSKIPSDKIPALKSALRNDVFAAKTYSSTTTLLLSIFLGGLGVDRFYVGDVGLGIAKLLFGWITLGIWPFIDIFVSYKKARIKNFENIMAVL